ncbi:selT/selW/selH selenoprotein domain-containing protein [Jiulongibacter sediminis]|jgi:selenoprotein W-related protein|uniref:SelT/selW/selH selenoprotein domain-containing protein n=2 Tax=Jiulongibacter sediminis TaxID=1605367 RepID=A0A0N8HAF0_9BACT|nr:selT/selW/selH selenoprotein domain-containing protein [Jiulongibacter sediminis]
MLRAAWIAQELLTTFEQELTEVSLVPSKTGGIFQVRTPDKLVFDRKEYGGFPEPKVLKQLVRDAIAPQKKLGHSDSTSE